MVTTMYNNRIYSFQLNLCSFVEFWSGDSIESFHFKIRLIRQTVEENYDKVKMFQVRKNSRAFSLTPLNTLKTVKTLRYEPKDRRNEFCDVNFFSITSSAAGMKCKMLQCTYLFF